MDSKGYCKLLTNFKLNGIRFSSYMGIRWLVSKFIILFAGLLMILNEDKIANIVGYILLGYFLGAVIANIRTFIASKSRWELQKEFLDWEKIESFV